MVTKRTIESGQRFTPKFDENGLIPAIAQDAKTGRVLMMAYMNREALDLTIRTGYAVYFSRKRRRVWKKGEESGHIQKIEQILIDCDQDCLLLKVKAEGGQCHVGYQSCFYRALKKGSKKSGLRQGLPRSGSRLRRDERPDELEFIAKKAYNPAKIYKKGKILPS